ncbi:hypothetical protein FBZ33_2177 [Micromonospora sp. A202]|uniref:hypothetical protein n=1 Tax=Micromonospora sp. A202 TaxID=2572899 RepID=UPI0011733EA7|nr:hypothetical protein [Micromonospora sp. A202]TQJ21943.1 hypothetical protein FBZ33_2177 [Micromonospora sp. A202]
MARSPVPIVPKWHSPAKVAAILGYGLSKVKMKIATGELRAVLRSALSQAEVEELVAKKRRGPGEAPTDPQPQRQVMEQ